MLGGLLQQCRGSMLCAVFAVTGMPMAPVRAFEPSRCHARLPEIYVPLLEDEAKENKRRQTVQQARVGSGCMPARSEV